MVKRDLITQIILGLLLIFVVIFLRIFMFSSHKVTSKEANSFIRQNDVVLVNSQNQPKYKDFLVYEVEGKTYMGRLIAKEDETVTYMDDIFYLNNQVETQAYLEKFRTKYLAQSNRETPFTDDFTIETITKKQGQTTIPKGYYLILNDNRQNLEDSRTFGLIAKKQIKGVVTFRVLPLKDFGFTEVD